MVPEVIRVLIPATMTFIVGMAITPILTHYLYKHKMWKKKSGKLALDGSMALEFNRLHEVHETRAPRMGGIIVWASVLLTTLGTALLAFLTTSTTLDAINFLSRSQTWIPLATLVIGAMIGLLDDLMVIRESGEGMRLRYRLLFVGIISAFIGWGFYDKLGVTAIRIPFMEPFELGWLIIVLFVITSLALYASGVIDGIDGLSGGVFGSIFAAYSIIAFFQNQIDLAAFCASVVGGLLAFLWFNIPPARYYMTETGTMGLTLTLAVVAFMTNNHGSGVGVAVLPVIGGLLVATVATSVAQFIWKKSFGKKLLRIAPLHHHFEAIGWPGYKVVMRYWVLSIVLACAGVILAFSAH